MPGTLTLFSSGAEKSVTGWRLLVAHRMPALETELNLVFDEAVRQHPAGFLAQGGNAYLDRVIKAASLKAKAS